LKKLQERPKSAKPPKKRGKKQKRQQIVFEWLTKFSMWLIDNWA
jgi:hypothetical protein